MNKFLLILSFLLVSCATPYQPHGYSGGYSEARVAHDMFRVQFAGNGNTHHSLVEQYLLKRCAQLTLENGFTHFVVSNQQGTTDSQVHGSYGVNTFGVYTVNRYTAVAVIKMLKNPSSDLAAYDASMIYQPVERAPSSK